MSAPGERELNMLRAAGFNDLEMGQYVQDQRTALGTAGFSKVEVDEYFGRKIPDMTPTQKYFNDVFKQLEEEKTDDTGAREAISFNDYLEAGWQMSVTGLEARGRLPDVVLPEDAPWYARAVSTLATLGGDAPEMATGAFGGGLLGSAVAPGPGTIIGAGAGAFAVPAALREMLIQRFENGEINDASEFLDRALAISSEGAKGAVIGGLTTASGGSAQLLLRSAPPAIRALGQTGAEVATLATVARGVEGELPNRNDFVDAAVLVGGLRASVKATTHLTKKLGKTYAETGSQPGEVALEMQKDANIAQDIASTNKDLPAKLEPFRELPKVDKDAVTGKPIPEKPAVEKGPSSVGDAQAEVLARVGEPESKPFSWHDLYTDFVNDFHPLHKLTKEVGESHGKQVDILQDAGKMAQLSRGSFGKADHFLEFGTFDFNTLRNTGRSIRQILDPVKKDLDGWRAYAISKRALELEGRGIDTGVPTKTARTVVREGKSKFAKSFKEVVDYQNNLAKYMKDAGFLSEKGFNQMLEANKDFVPFFRVFGAEEGVAASGAGRRGFRQIKGSERQLLDPLESILKNTYSMVEAADKNAVALVIGRMAKTRPDLVKKVKQPRRPIEVSESELQKFAEEHGLEGDITDTLTIFRPGAFNPKPNQIVAFENGKRVVYEVPLDVAKAFNATDRQTAGLMVKILSVPAKTLRAGAVLSPEFMSRNLIRDQMAAFVNSSSGFKPITDTIRGMSAIIGKTETFTNWLKAGGANASLVGIDRAYVMRDLFKLDKDIGLTRRAVNVVTTPFKGALEVLQITSQLLENATRVGAFKRTAQGKTSKSALTEGAFESREVTLDFARVGARTRAMNMITAFWNAHVQGLDRTVRVFKTDPKGAALRATISITVPSVLLWWANHDDPRWKEIPRWQKDMFWIVLTDDHIFRIPKPFELGIIFGSVPERILEQFFTDNPRALRDFEQTLIEGLIPDMIPTIATPPLEQFANKSTLTGAPLIPGYLEHMVPEYQYKPYTTQLTRALGKLVGYFTRDTFVSQAASPVVIDNYIRGWTGGLGNYALQLIDAGLRKSGVLPDPPRPSDTLADLPLVRGFTIRHPSPGNQQIRDFYERFNRNETILNTIRKLAAGGDITAAQRELQINPDALLVLRDTRDAIGNAASFARMIDSHPTMDPDEKRQLIDMAYFQMIHMATQGNQQMDQIEPLLK